MGLNDVGGILRETFTADRWHILVVLSTPEKIRKKGFLCTVPRTERHPAFARREKQVDRAESAPTGRAWVVLVVANPGGVQSRPTSSVELSKRPMKQ